MTDSGRGPGRGGGASSSDHAIATGDTMADLGGELHVGQLVGEYRVEGRLGEGGMGVVYAALHPVIGKRAAIKVLRRELCSDPEAIGRFVQEARAVNQIGHPNIVDVFAFGELPDGRSYFVMELLPGDSLRQRLRRGPLPRPAIYQIVGDIARALGAAHTKGIIHRDLKPDNVFLAEVHGDDRPRVKLLDFGIAKLTSNDVRLERTRTGSVVGTPQYIAPEQARGYQIDERVDIYALGVMLFELIAGRPPFEADNAMDMVAKHLNEPPPRLASCATDVPAALDQLVDAMLSKDRTRRPALAEVRAALEALPAAGVTAPRLPEPSVRADAVDPLAELDVVPARSRRGAAVAIGLLLAIAAAVIAFFAVRASRDQGPGSPPTPPLTPTTAVIAPAVPVAVDAATVVATAAVDAAPMTPPAQTGVLTVKVKVPAGVTITVDGEATPDGINRAIELPVGPHVVAVWLRGRQVLTRTVEIAAGKTTTIKYANRGSRNPPDDPNALMEPGRRRGKSP